jgi:adenosylcobyric acid synthase
MGAMPARPLFVGGTSSNAGKSWMTTAICAWLRARGVRVAPFKAQTMSNHSYPCRGGGEIGRAQVVQAEACGLEPEPAMNPILLKPNGNGTSQVVLHGRVWRTLAPRDYYAAFDRLIGEVLDAYDDLARRFDVVVIEGAGSVSELNLRRYDLVNLGLATRIGAPWVLVADIERGGVIASVAGTVALLSPDERRLFRGFLINKFRGDRTLFDEGRAILEAQTGAPCLGVFPFAEDLRVDAEDSLAVDRAARRAAPGGASIAVIALPRASNATDLRRLDWAHWLSAPPADARRYDFVVLPGTKDTLGDLAWLRARGLDGWVRAQHAAGATVIGICGGYQMLGRAVDDHAAVEAGGGRVDGLGLLPVRTRLAPDKVTRAVEATTPGGAAFAAYEIHHGVTTHDEPLPPFATLADGTADGARHDRVIGTYLHGALEDPAVCAEMFGVAPGPARDRAAEHAALAGWFSASAERTDEWLPEPR